MRREDVTLEDTGEGWRAVHGPTGLFEIQDEAEVAIDLLAERVSEWSDPLIGLTVHDLSVIADALDLYVQVADRFRGADREVARALLTEARTALDR